MSLNLKNIIFGGLVLMLLPYETNDLFSLNEGWLAVIPIDTRVDSEFELKNPNPFIKCPDKNTIYKITIQKPKPRFDSSFEINTGSENPCLYEKITDK